MLATDATPATSGSKPFMGECMEVPPDNEHYDPNRGSGMMQKLDSFQESCRAWIPSAAEIPPRPEGCLGPLESLVGTWKGYGRGYSWVPVVPMPALKLSGPKFTSTAQYRDEIVVEPIIGAILNKAYNDNDQLHPSCRVDQALHGLSYRQEVRIEYEGEFHTLLHLETGNVMYNVVPGWDANYTLSRNGATPRGITFETYGSHAEFVGEDLREQLVQDMAVLDIKMLPTDRCVDATARLGDVADTRSNDPDARESLVDMRSMLVDAVNAESLPVVKYTKLSFTESTVNGGAFLSKAANPANLKAFYYILHFQNPTTGEVTQKLFTIQYSTMDFFQRLDCITCPGLVRDSDGCYPLVTQDSLDGCFVDNSLDPTCSEKPYISWPHIQVGFLQHY